MQEQWPPELPHLRKALQLLSFQQESGGLMVVCGQRSKT
jgi:hypothetical protein